MNNAVATILAMNTDFVALQEIGTSSSYTTIDTLVKRLGGDWAGFILPWLEDNCAQNLAFVYRTSKVQYVSSQTMSDGPTVNGNTWSYSWSNGRFPVLFNMNYKINNELIPFSFVNIHAKAMGTVNDHARRTSGSMALKEILDGIEFSSRRTVLIGDFNDYLAGTSCGAPCGNISPYQNFLDDERWKGLTGHLTEINPGPFFGGSIIDNVIISNQLFPKFRPNSAILEESVTQSIPNFWTTTSDHAPLSVTFNVLAEVPTVNVSQSSINFGNTIVDNTSTQSLWISGSHLTETITYTLEVQSEIRILLEENFGDIPTASPWPSVSDFNGFQRGGEGASNVTYTTSGTVSVRSNTPSIYAGASGGNNAIISNGAGALYVNNIAPLGAENISLSFGTNQTSTVVSVGYSADGGSWIMIWPTAPGQKTTESWGLVNVDFEIPSGTTTLSLLFNAENTQFGTRIDDITVKGVLTGENDFSIVETSWNSATGGQLNVNFSPQELGTQNAIITFKSDGAETKTVYLTGTGIEVGKTIYFNEFTTSNDVSDWDLQSVWWNVANDGMLVFETVGSTATMPILPCATNLQITVTARYGDYIFLHTSPDGINYTDQGLFTGHNGIATASKTLPDHTRYVKFVAREDTWADVFLISVLITGDHDDNCPELLYPVINPIATIVGENAVITWSAPDGSSSAPATALSGLIPMEIDLPIEIRSVSSKMQRPKEARFGSTNIGHDEAGGGLPSPNSELFVEAQSTPMKNAVSTETQFTTTSNPAFVSISFTDEVAMPVASATSSPNGYMVYRLFEGADVANWVLLTSMTTELTYTDSDWSSLSNGRYQYAVYAVYEGVNVSPVRLTNVLVKIVKLDNDLQLLTIQYPYTRVPTSQIVPALPWAQVNNIGSATQTNVKLAATMNGTSIGATNPFDLNPGASFAPQLIRPTVSAREGWNTLVYTASGDQTNEGTSNTATFGFIGDAQGVYAVDDFENVTPRSYFSGGTTALGNIFEITKNTILNQVVVWLANMSGDTRNFDVSVYALMDDGVTLASDTPLVSQTAIAEHETFWQYHEIDVSPTTLDPGYYFVVATPLDNVQGFGIGFHEDNKMLNWFNDGQIVQTWPNGWPGASAAVRIVVKEEETQPVEPITIKWRNDLGWEDMYLYAWSWINNSVQYPLGEWPGTQVTPDANGWYSHTFENMDWAGFIFNNGTNAQSADNWAYSGTDVCIEILSERNNNSHHLYNFTDCSVKENDLRIFADVFPYTQIPTSQRLPILSAKARNMGSETQTNVKLLTTINGNSFGESVPVESVVPNTTSPIMSITPTTNAPLGDNTLVYTVSGSQTNEGDRNTTAIAFKGTNDIYAVDNATDFSGGVGWQGGSGTYGNIFEITNETYLIGAQIGFGDFGGASNFMISLYEMIGETTTASEPLFTQVAVRSPGSLVTFDLPQTQLTPGRYILCVSQLSGVNFGIAFDGNTNKPRNTVFENEVYSWYNNFGALAIRMVVGTPIQNNLAIRADQPVPYTMIPISQHVLPTTLTAKAQNVGFSTQTNVKLSVAMNGTLLGESAPVATLASGATSETLNVTNTRTNLPLGDNTFVYTVRGDQVNQGQSNTITYSVKGTEDVFAHDALTTDFWRGAGSNSPITIGNIFEITNETSLVGVQIGFASEIPLNYSVSVYAITDEFTIAHTPVATQSAVRNEIGLATVNIAPTALAPGRYFVAVDQLGDDGISVAYDAIDGKVFYIKDGNGLRPGNATLGAIAVRMVLGKTPGAEVGTPVLANRTYNSITINIVNAPSNGQSVEYAICTTNNAKATVLSWQAETTFGGLFANTNYYVYARSAENINNLAGTPSVSELITTLPTPAHGITLNPSGSHIFTNATFGYGTQTPHSVLIINVGNQPTGALNIALSGTHADNFELSKTSVPSIATGNFENYFTVVPKTGLVVETYTATVTVSGDNNISESFNVSFTVNKANGEIVNAPTLANATHNSITVNAVADPSNGQTVEYAIARTNSANVSTLDWQTETTFGNLLASTTYYIYARSANNENHHAGVYAVSATITTLAAPSHGITLSQIGTHTFTTANFGYPELPALSVTITNEGTLETGPLTIVLNGENSNDFTLSKPSVSSIATYGSDNFTVVPKTGLVVGTYTASVTVSNDNVSKNFTVSFTVNKAEGATVEIPTLANATHESITVNAITQPSNGQTVEYAIHTTNTANPSAKNLTWQHTTTFGSLTPSTTYFVYARSAYHDNHHPGIHAVSEAIVALAEPTVSVTGVTLNKNAITLNVSDNEQLIATVLPTNANNQNVTWSSNNQAVAMVNTSGLVVAVSKGTAVITVTTTDGSHTDLCVVTVNDPSSSVDSETNEGLKIYPNPVFEGKLFVEIPETMKNENVQIYDFSGRLVLTRVAHDLKTEINISHLPDGTYIVRISTHVVKIIKR
jgi:hypothetical protein